ncbi:hypothetical protein [Legionella sp. km772]|uniref:hypothetical protein n=1 Tax=Legionella sp. km772 TaxID=2498111 RepID=UPI000F8CB05C|nr:hypothetical protein [Legionella sp. km772]RUR04147.1 hypothetical protein ELY15_15820 [Legionella sp. km772]
MSLSKLDLTTLAKANPYLTLGNADALVEHQEILDSLSETDQKELATNLLFHCPDKELKALGHAIRAIKPHDKDNGCFYHVLNRGFETRSRIKGLYDPANAHPHYLLSGADFAADLFNEFAELSARLLDKKELAIACKLALTTPQEARNSLARNVRTAFPDSLLSTKLGAAFALRREIDVSLLGDAPYNFFLSAEFNKDSYLEFAELFQLIDDKVEEIAAKMAGTPEIKRAQVLENMIALFPGSSLVEKTTDLFAAPVKTKAPVSGMFQVASPKATSTQKDSTPTNTF